MLDWFNRIVIKKLPESLVVCIKLLTFEKIRSMKHSEFKLSKYFVYNFSIMHYRYHWIRRKGKPAPREVAPIIVSNHVSYIDPIYFFYELFPTIVASESHDSMPLVGTIIRAMQVTHKSRYICGNQLIFSILYVFVLLWFIFQVVH
jgi:1-acyl-sn-glycerol-3-phosphate acyltransferase